MFFICIYCLSTLTWVVNRPKKGLNYYEVLKKKFQPFQPFIVENELLAVPSVMETVNTRAISLLMTDMMSWRFIIISRDGMEEALKSLNIGVKVLARRSNVMWDILLVSKEEVKSLARIVLTMKAVRLQTKFMGTRKTQVILHAMLMYISEDHLEAFMVKYGCVQEMSAIKSQANIAKKQF